jgi:predicted nucleotidyltransferase
MSPSAEVIDDLVHRITSGVQPRRIILFGSAARGEMGPDSDLDLLVVMADGCDRLATAQTIYRLLRGFPHPKDVIVVQESDVKTLGDNPSLVVHTALTEGKELYRAAS